MPVDALRAIRFCRRVERCHVRADRQDWLDSLGLRTARDFLALPGVVVSGHIGRNVSRVQLGGTTAYLKREHRVRMRDRFRSWRDGFGWASISAREAAVLLRLEDHDLPGPRWLAFGEADGQAFLLLEAAEGMVDLRSLGTTPDELAGRLGRVIAGIHAAGIDQPDLFAKHILVQPEDQAVMILDWQRAVFRKRVELSSRIRSLAALRATASDELILAGAWDRFLNAYLTESDRLAQPPMNRERFRRLLEAKATTLLRRPSIRSQRMVTAISINQELVRIGGEKVCAIPAVAVALQSDAAIAALYDPANDGQRISLSEGRAGLLRVRRYGLPFGRWWAALRGRSWRSPELKAARLLFHLERHGIPAPKLLAYGQMMPRAAPACSFLLMEPIRGRPVGPQDEAAVRSMLDRLHAAGCRLIKMGRGGLPFGSADGLPVIRDVTGLRLTRRLGRRQIESDRARLDAFFRGLR